MKLFRRKNEKKSVSRAEFNEMNKSMNLYYDEFQACKKTWIQSFLVGLGLSVLLTWVFCGFQIVFDSDVLELFFIVVISVVPTLIIILGLKNTSDFGLAYVFLVIAEFGLPLSVTLCVTIILAPLGFGALAITCVLLLIAAFAFLFFFPLETLYYWIRYSIEKATIKWDARK